ncbi:VWA domain-containing protein [Agarivorans sp. TSD2052]|uniref:vWA domain-containing protein n=1 Tax=Agarivorans sp. TSD2052 TaxID=2937286 RepID=UPI00200F4C0E|nr:VWA domain-containing protein [Agarivorans sp. TSD2052]UPW16721.1 VWA domain-containing protein [Agarivorans sp. TSD2052]
MFDFSILSQALSQFHFLRPHWLFALLPMAVVFFVQWRMATKHQSNTFLPEHLKKALTINQRGWKNLLPLKVLAIGFSVLIIICAGPTWQRLVSPFSEDKASLLVVLDVSESMLQQDIAPNRLERAKHKIQDLMELRQGGRSGLIVYAGSAHWAMPATQDKQVFAPFLSAISLDIMPVRGKSAEQALSLIDEQFKGQQGNTVLLMTDGATPKTIDHYQRYFKDSPNQLLVLAVGNRDIISQSPLDISSLTKLAQLSKGRLIEASIDDTDVRQLNRLINSHMTLNGESAMPWKDMGYYLLFPVALLLLLWFRKGWLVQWCFVALVLIPGAFPLSAMANDVNFTRDDNNQALVQDISPAPLGETITLSSKVTQWWLNLWLTPNQQGQRLLNRQQYLPAAKHYSDPLRKGVAYYYAAEYSLAHSEFLKLDSDLGYFYAASSLARQREYIAARHLLTMLLESSSLSHDLSEQVRHNLNVINGIVEEINRLSKSQTGTTESMEESFELDDNPQTADGAEETTIAELMVKETLNANEILGSEELANKWLKRVESDPKLFLHAKFHIQYRDQNKDGDTNGL